MILTASFIALQCMDSWMQKSNMQYSENLERLRDQAEYKRVTEGYKIMTAEGFQFLAQHQYDDAMRSFAEALNLRRNGHSANYGITKTLIHQCIKKGEFCSEADKYFKSLQNSGAYQESELTILQNLRDGI